MTNKISFVLSVIFIALLQACGGGGGSTNSVNVASTGSAGTSTGSVSATFNRSATARYHLTSTGGQLFGRLDNSVQETNGAMTTLGSSVLSGDKVVKEISGDASYALGRWTAGTVTTSSGAATLTGTDNKAYHYIAFNVPNAFPASGSLTCDAGAFTAPTYVGGGVATGAGSGTGTGAFDSGTASGSATLTFGADGAAVGGNISVAASGSSGSISLKTSGMTPNGSSINGAYLSNGAGAYIQVGDAGTGAYLVVGSYAVSLANGAR